MEPRHAAETPPERAVVHVSVVGEDMECGNMVAEFREAMLKANRRAFGPQQRPQFKVVPWIFWFAAMLLIFLAPGYVLFPSAPLPFIVLISNVVSAAAPFLYYGLSTRSIINEAESTLRSLYALAGKEGAASALEARRAASSLSHMAFMLVWSLVNVALFGIFLVYPAKLGTRLGWSSGTWWDFIIPIILAVVLYFLFLPFYVFGLFGLVVPQISFQSKAIEVSLKEWHSAVSAHQNDFDIAQMTEHYHRIHGMIASTRMYEMWGVIPNVITFVFGVVVFATSQPLYNPYIAWLVFCNVMAIGGTLNPLAATATLYEKPLDELRIIRGTVTRAPGSRRDDLDSFLAYVALSPLVLRFAGVEMRTGTVMKLMNVIMFVLVFFLGNLLK